MIMSEQLFCGIEMGGTKVICAIGNSRGEIMERINIPTKTPDNTMPEIINYFTQIQKNHSLGAIGVACFGPIDLNRESETYGFITTTPKVTWQNFDFVKTIQEALELPVGFDTDVNAAALGEERWGAGKGLHSLLYLTVGTGIGGGVLCEGKLLHGLQHPEMGHIIIPRDPSDLSFKSVCPYHENCVEGLASGPSIKNRWHVNSALDLPPNHEAWKLEANYLGIAIANYILALIPQRIILGGGVMKQKQLFPMIREKVLADLNGYIAKSEIIKDIDHYIVPTGLGQNSGICGAIALAEAAYQSA
jgi:fructokinase